MAILNTAKRLKTATEMPCDQVRKAICTATFAACENSLGTRLRGLVLTGSLARNEATFVSNNGAITLLSDADFLMVLNSPVAEHPPKKNLQNLERTVSAQLAQTGIHVQVGLGTVAPDYFNHLRNSSFAFELKSNGQVVAGDSTLLDRIPAYDPANLSREDAWRTLNHRMIEVIGDVEVGSLQESWWNDQFEYAVTKLYLDMATSFLIFVGRYVPTYVSRAKALCSLAAGLTNSGQYPFDLGTFSRVIEECTDRKLNGTHLDATRPVAFLGQAIRWAVQLWHWEIAKLTGIQRQMTIKDSIAAMGRLQSFDEKLRGWGSLARRAGFRLTLENAPRWIQQFRLATPRYLIYGAAAEFWGELSSVIKDRPPAWDQKLAQSLLPVATTRSSSDEFCDLARDISWHYRTFLLNTVS